ncbi:hypothetical protein [Pelagibacterium montanilacus]|uniref:hypothetical protein n=1 Tax=Pelagibacterium montanilacus TaxID=2185280 RepID=UPI000F8D7888|nr:hypothetical protein [Pelagibacterium montanilacus]
MSAIRVARTVMLIGLAASRNPVVRQAFRNAPRAIPEEHRRAAAAVGLRAARKAGEITARIIPPNRYF